MERGCDKDPILLLKFIESESAAPIIRLIIGIVSKSELFGHIAIPAIDVSNSNGHCRELAIVFL